MFLAFIANAQITEAWPLKGLGGGTRENKVDSILRSRGFKPSTLSRYFACPNFASGNGQKANSTKETAMLGFKPRTVGCVCKD